MGRFLEFEIGYQTIITKLDFIHLNIDKKQGKLRQTLRQEVADATLQAEYITMSGAFARLFSKRIWEHAKILLIGAVLSRAVRTVLRVMGLSGEKKRMIEINDFGQNCPFFVSADCTALNPQIKQNEPIGSFLWARRDSNPQLLLCDSKVSFSTASNTSISCVFVWIFAFFRGLNVHYVQYFHCVFF
jgi:hypothetical protein